MTAHELVIRFGRPFDVTMPGKDFMASVREVRIPFADRESAEAAQREITVSVRPVHDAGGEDYRPVIPGEVVTEPAGIESAAAWRPVVKCLNCGRPVHQRAQPAWRPAGLIIPVQQRPSLPDGMAALTPPVWTHWGFWQGRRCPGALTGAEPGGEFTEDEYWAWVDGQIGRRQPPVIAGPAGIEQEEP